MYLRKYIESIQLYKKLKKPEGAPAGNFLYQRKGTTNEKIPFSQWAAAEPSLRFNIISAKNKRYKYTENLEIV